MKHGKILGIGTGLLLGMVFFLACDNGDSANSGTAPTISEIFTSTSESNCLNEIKTSVLMYVEAYYNRMRIHSALGYVAPDVLNILLKPDSSDKKYPYHLLFLELNQALHVISVFSLI
jgi:hypothetical protein